MQIEPIRFLGRILDAPLVVIAGREFNLATLLTFLLIIAAAYLLSRIAQRGVGRLLPVRDRRRRSVEVTQRLLHYTILGVGIAVGLHAIGINLAALFAAGAVLAVAIGFAMQNIAQNFVSGVILLVERSIQPGDVLEVEGEVVQVEEMRIRSTVARTRFEEELIIPNSALVQTTVKNFTLRDSLYRVTARVGVVYGSDMDRVRRVLEQTAEAIPWRSDREEPRILLRGFGSSSVDWDVSVWVEDPWLAPRFLSELNEAIWRALGGAGVTIAFPQLDVHLDPEVERALGARPEGPAEGPGAR